MPEKCFVVTIALCRITFLTNLYYTCHMNGIFVNEVPFSTECSLFNDVFINSYLKAANDRMIENAELEKMLIQENAA